MRRLPNGERISPPRDTDKVLVLDNRLRKPEEVIESVNVTGRFECDIDISHLDLTRSDFEQGLSDAQKEDLGKLLDQKMLHETDLENLGVFLRNTNTQSVIKV